MRIVQIEKQRKWAGQIQQAFLLAKGLHQRGHDVLVVCQPGAIIGDRAAELGIEVMRLPMQGLHIFPSACRLAHRLWRTRYHVLHPHGGRDHLLAMLAHILVPRVKVVRTKHNLNPVRGAFFLRLLTTRFIAVSAAARAVLRAACIPRQKIALIHDGLDLAPFRPAPPDPALLQELGILRDDFVIGVTGRLGSKSKGIPVLLHATPHVLKSAPQAKFLLVGRAKPALQDLARKLGLDHRVIFTGFRQDIPQLLACMHLYVQPSLRDAFPSSVIEAMAMTKVVVGSRVGGIPEAVRERETGMLCAPGNPEELARTILKLVGKTGTLHRMGILARERALENFSLDRMLDDVETLYRNIAKDQS